MVEHKSREGQHPSGRSRAIRIVSDAWRALPSEHRELLEEVGASQWDVLTDPLGDPVDRLLRSGDHQGLSQQEREQTNAAIAVWLPELRIVVFNGAHPVLSDLDEHAFEQALARAAWHEWGHALSIVRCSGQDVADGDRLLALAPTSLHTIVRAAGYRRSEYTHELVANVYAMLVEQLQLGASGKPQWLHQEIYDLVKRVTGWPDRSEPGRDR